MPLMNEEFLLSEIAEFVVLQEAPVDCFVKKYPSVKDWKFLLDAPKRGSLRCQGESWNFLKHGAGLEFTQIDGLVVDVHRCFCTFPNGIDAHRLNVFLESKKIELVEFAVNCEVSEGMLAGLADKELLCKVKDVGGLYLMSQHNKKK